MSKIKFIKANAAPTSGNWESDAVYFVAKTIAGQTAAEMYVTDQAGNPREVSTENLVLEIIETLKGAAGGLAGLDNNGKVQVSQLPAGIGIEFEIVPNIAARNALSPQKNILCLVLDASADPTVTAGNALYAYELASTTWHKVAEFESMDLTGLMRKFRVRANTGTAIDIQENDLLTFQEGTNIQITRSGNTFTFSVTGSGVHSHANLTQLAKISEDGDGDINYDGQPVMKWASNAW